METNNIANHIITNDFVEKYNITNINNDNEKILDYVEYCKTNILLTKYKIPELKKIAKHHNIKITGTKPVLISRIKTHFHRIKLAIKIQALFRGFVLRISLKLRGPALKNRTICVNDNDFVSLEPIDEIEIENFYSYTDSKNFTYGFDIGSLAQSLKQKGKLENPYNREKLDTACVNNIKRLHSLSFIVFPEFKNNHERIIINQRNARFQNRNYIINTHNDNINYVNRQNVIFTPEQQNRISRLIETRNTSLSQRIINLFMEIDQLGNYTQISWFESLNIDSFVRLYGHLYDIWYTRSQTPREIRVNICPFPNPFSNSNYRYLTGAYGLDPIKTACVEAFENLVFTGSDDEYRKLGAIYVLIALSMVSTGAREAMPWLYESVSIF
jgi:hypothetical protein